MDTTHLPDDPVGTRFTAQSGSSNGDALDRVLDDLQAKLGPGGKNLSDASAVAGGGTSGAVTAGSAVGTGPCSAVTAENNTKFLALVASKCTQDAVLSNEQHDAYTHCNHSNLDTADNNLVLNTWRGALPNNGTVPNLSNTGFIPKSGPGVGFNATLSVVTGVAGAAAGRSCKGQIVEPYIPFVDTRINGVNNIDVGGGGSGNKWSFRGAAQDTIYVTTGGVVLQYNMTDNAGKRLSVQFDTTTGLSSATVGEVGDPSFWVCL